MSTTVVHDEPAGQPAQAPPPGGRLVRALGWLLVTSGAVLLLYFVYLLWFTGLATDRAQDELRSSWEQEVGALPVEVGADVAGASGAVARDSTRRDLPRAAPVVEGEAVAALWFERPGRAEPLVQPDPLFVLEGTSLDVLRSGPGRYVDTALPGGDGNFAVAGHRTTNSAPFYDLDQLRDGDLVHVVDRAGVQWSYEFRQQLVVAPGDDWVIGTDPLGTGRPQLTLTTCHPRFSDAQRLVVLAELVS